MTLAEQIKVTIREAETAYRFNPGSYNYEALNQCFALRAAIEGVLGPLDGLHDKPKA